MCVAVTLEPGATLTKEEVEKMDRANSDGVGVAWAQGGTVSWFKTTKVEPAYIERLVHYWSNYPRLVHFRLSTAGGTRSDLCHPFEVGPLANCKTQGSSGQVMIHNGHWGRWQEVHALLEAEDLLPDKGPWSDSRLAAFLAHQDEDWYQALGGRVAVLKGDGSIKRLGDWEQLRNGIYVSNKFWSYRSYPRGGYSGYREWKGWEWDDDDWNAYFAESKERETKDAEEKAKQAEAEAAEDAIRKSQKGKAHSGSSTPGAHVIGGPRSSGGAHAPYTGGAGRPSAYVGDGVGARGDSGAVYSSDDGVVRPSRGATYLASQSGYRHPISEEPYYNATAGKWYKWSNEARAVVETTAPGSVCAIGPRKAD